MTFNRFPNSICGLSVITCHCEMMLKDKCLKTFIRKKKITDITGGKLVFLYLLFYKPCLLTL